jgi:hypothetical protein
MANRLVDRLLKPVKFCCEALIAPLKCSALILLGAALTALAAEAADADKVQGPNACAECHKEEAEAWKVSHHFKTFREMPRRKEGQEIAKKMGLRRIKSEGICLSCHFTVQKVRKKAKAVAGISCESCHSAGEDWIKVHSEYSGKTEKTESKAEAAARWKLAESKGMIRPSSIYRLAKNCYSCHVVPQEELVNIGGHKAGSDFELLSWSQGEIRHNTWYSKGKNLEADAARKRLFYVVGQAVELETALRAIGKATIRQPYAFDMAKRADKARKSLAAIANAAPNIPELAKMVQLGHAAGLKLKNDQALTAAADGISKQMLSLTSKYSQGDQLAAIDPLLPGPNAYKGKARQ